MKCKNLAYRYDGMVYDDEKGTLTKEKLTIICTNDEAGKTLSIDNGQIQFTISVEPLLEIFEGDYRK